MEIENFRQSKVSGYYVFRINDSKEKLKGLCEAKSMSQDLLDRLNNSSQSKVRVLVR